MSNRSIEPREVRVGVVVPHWSGSYDGRTPRWSEIADFARVAEELGFDSLWLIDDLLIRLDLEESPAGNLQEELDMVAGTGEPVGFWECWSLLGSLAATTTRAELGQVITNNNFRAPALLAKMADTIDEISGGRLILGLGAGNNEFEHRAFGVPWEHRFERFEEAVPIIRDLLRLGQLDLEGDHYSIDRCQLLPRGPAADGPPILIGGRGPRVIRLAARFADQWNVGIAFTHNSPNQVSSLQDAVDSACESVGRDPATLERTAFVAACVLDGHVEFCGQDMSAANPLQGSAEQIAERIATFGAAGFRHLQLYLAPATLNGLEAFAPVLAQLRA